MAKVRWITYPVESDRFGLNLTFFDINLVTAENDWDVLANTDKIAMPVWNVLVGDSTGDIEHDDTTLAINVISISQTTKLLLTL